MPNIFIKMQENKWTILQKNVTSHISSFSWNHTEHILVKIHIAINNHHTSCANTIKSCNKFPISSSNYVNLHRGVSLPLHN